MTQVINETDAERRDRLIAEIAAHSAKVALAITEISSCNAANHVFYFAKIESLAWLANILSKLTQELAESP